MNNLDLGCKADSLCCFEASVKLIYFFISYVFSKLKYLSSVDRLLSLIRYFSAPVRYYLLVNVRFLALAVLFYEATSLKLQDDRRKWELKQELILVLTLFSSITWVCLDKLDDQCRQASR